VQYSGGALVRALLDRAVTHSDPSRDGEVPPAAMADYTNTHSVLMDLNAGCAPPEGPSSSTEALSRRSEMPGVLIPFSLLQNRYRAAKLELFLNPDPRRGVEGFVAGVSRVLSDGAKGRRWSEAMYSEWLPVRERWGYMMGMEGEEDDRSVQCRAFF